MVLLDASHSQHKDTAKAGGGTEGFAADELYSSAHGPVTPATDIYAAAQTFSAEASCLLSHLVHLRASHTPLYPIVAS